MRKLVALVALLCGTASADAAGPQKYCSDGFDKHAELIVTSESQSLTIGQKPVEIEDGHEPAVEEALLPLSKDQEPISVLIYQDRIFWPCP